jgi:hypothetical protein
MRANPSSIATLIGRIAAILDPGGRRHVHGAMCAAPVVPITLPYPDPGRFPMKVRDAMKARWIKLIPAMALIAAAIETLGAGAKFR